MPVALPAEAFDPVISGRIFAPDATDSTVRTPLRVVMTAASSLDSSEVDSSGRFTIRLIGPGRGATLSVDAIDPLRRRYHPATVALDSIDARDEVRIVLVPSRWTISGGRHDGRNVAIDPAVALGEQPGNPGRFWRLSSGHRGTARVPVGWPRTAIPVPLALRAPEWGPTLSSSDSARFWEIVHELEYDLGMPLFTPLVWDGDSVSNGRIVVGLKPSLRADGKSYLMWNADGSVFDGAVFFRTPKQARDPRVVSHELMHVLGFGHTRAWHSLMTTTAHSIAAPSVEDVAYAQLAVRLRWLQQEHGIRYGVRESAVRR